MAFLEIQFPVDIAYGAQGGPAFKTDLAEVNNGAEQRNSVWEDARCEYDVAHGVKSDSQLRVLLAFFRVVRGMAVGFRFKDWTDYDAVTGEGIFQAIDATHFQLVKRYTASGNNHDRLITKPVNGTLTITGGTVASVDYTTGIVTMTSGTPTGWTGQFDVPCRFNTDRMITSIEDIDAYSWNNIPVIEVRV